MRPLRVALLALRISRASCLDPCVSALLPVVVAWSGWQSSISRVICVEMTGSLSITISESHSYVKTSDCDCLQKNICNVIHVADRRSFVSLLRDLCKGGHALKPIGTHRLRWQHQEQRAGVAYKMQCLRLCRVEPEGAAVPPVASDGAPSVAHRA